MDLETDKIRLAQDAIDNALATVGVLRGDEDPGLAFVFAEGLRDCVIENAGRVVGKEIRMGLKDGDDIVDMREVCFQDHRF